ncbi:MAG: hypothetical protein ACM3X1_08805 [Ignavibacteriales bacterium]
MTTRVENSLPLTDLFLWPFHKPGRSPGFLGVDMHFQAASKMDENAKAVYSS